MTTVLKFLPLVWAALWRNRTESVLTLLALSVAFALFGTMITVKAAYERAIDDTRMDRLIVACAFDCGVIPLGYREQLSHIPHVTAVGGELWASSWYGQDLGHPITVTFTDEGMRSAWPELPMSPDPIVGNLRYQQNWGRLDERYFVHVMRVAVDRPEHARSVCREIETQF